jgi:predicted metal-dependent peptidase
MITQKLQDPDGVVDAKTLAELNAKISACLTGMYRKPNAGGNPFLYALSVSKPHFLAADAKLSMVLKKDGKNVPAFLMCPTAATDGKSYFWHPDFLTKLTTDEIPTVMEHEALHVAFDHPGRMRNASYTARAYAVDYVVNSCIEKNHKMTQRKGQLWGGNLGVPVLLQVLLDHIDGKIDAFPEKTRVIQVMPSGSTPSTPASKGISVEEPEPRIFADIACYGRSPESIYDEIMEHWDKSPRKCSACGSLNMDPVTRKPKKPPCSNHPACKHNGMCCPKCGAVFEIGPGGDGIPFPVSGMPSPMDSHIDAKISRQEAQREIMEACASTKSMRGNVPSEIEDMLGQLMEPVIEWTDIVFSDCLRRAQDSGLRNDWMRPRKRWMAATPSMYLPSRFSHTKKWLALLDTSGSMSAKDMAFVTSQLKVLCAKGCDGLIVPCDAIPHWGAATSVSSVEDLRRTRVAGRGGTVFEDFFRDYRKMVGEDYDAIIILTDGDCGTIPTELRPRVPVTWVLTKTISGWAPTFGRTAPLRHERI